MTPAELADKWARAVRDRAGDYAAALNPARQWYTLEFPGPGLVEIVFEKGPLAGQVLRLQARDFEKAGRWIVAQVQPLPGPV